MELKILHPLVAKWLEEKGYEYQHEAKLPEYGRADFLGRKSDGKILIIECKPKLDHRVRSHVMQLLGYCHQIEGEVKGALAIPRGEISDFAQAICNKYDVGVIEIEITELESLSKTFAIRRLPNDMRSFPLIVAEQGDFPLACYEYSGKKYIIPYMIGLRALHLLEM
jgi:hypothetical protein